MSVSDNGFDRNRRHSPKFSVYGLLASAIAVVSALWVAWQIITVAISDYFSLTEPEIALAWNPDHAEALQQIAERQLSLLPDKDVKAPIMEAARHIISEKPLSGFPFRALASVAEANENEERAESLMRIAAFRTRRDVRAQIWLADEELLKKDYTDALVHIDALLRVWPQISDRLFPVLAQLATERDAKEALIGILQKDPPWRAGLFATLPESTKDLPALQEFYSAFREGPIALRADELRPYLNALISNGSAELAHTIWLGTFGEDQPDTSGAYNGDFEIPISGLPFDWTLEEVRGAKAKIVLFAKNEHALLVEFYNTQVAFRQVSEVVLLKPGFYKFSGKVKADALQNERGLQWSLSCVSGNKERLAETERTYGTIAWTPFQVDFRVPDTDCEAQILRLELPARVPSEAQVSGSIWFDKLQITPVAPPV